MPEVDSLAELNERIRGWEAEDDDRRIADRIRTVGEDFATEQPLLAPLPVEPFDPGLVLTPRVDRSSLITVRMVKYSVPVRFIGRKVRVSLRANEVVVFDGRTPIAAHPRIAAHRHQRATGPLPGSAQDQTRRVPRVERVGCRRATGTFTSAHEAFWAAARRVNGDASRTRELIDVLLLHAA
ncbi:hypothetical protein MAGR_62170 [Mycolicibacterium agri]|uniref:Transposase for insertion sequence element IS21-like C-terminal domain-containing protein n=1 Tax=Mycolicibacterium agri TaxID=36811 RepID=A0A7I9WC45_MYCAG|nr:hypothetical protein MAGR_62170 [Mycolicibacterium agri]